VLSLRHGSSEISAIAGTVDTEQFAGLLHRRLNRGNIVRYAGQNSFADGDSGKSPFRPTLPRPVSIACYRSILAGGNAVRSKLLLMRAETYLFVL
jgi:hypothetical protein